MHTNTTIVSPEKRREQILQLLAQEGESNIDQLATRFGVSGMTIRRDLATLSQRGQIVRTHGGAASSSRVSFEFRFLERTQHHAAEKARIAALAAQHIRSGQSVLLDSGTTTLAIARELPKFRDITVVTTSLPVASQLFGLDNVQVLLLGGVLRKERPDLSGAITDANLAQISADIAFLGADAIGQDGWLYNDSSHVVGMLQRMAEAAREVYAVADHSKLQRRSLMRVAHLRQWQGLLTDEQLDPADRHRLERAGVRVFQPEESAEA